MTITTAKGRVFDTTKPAKSNLMLVFNEHGQRVFDTLTLTGKTTTETEYQQPQTMIEVEHSFGITEINEDFIWQ